MKIKPIAFSFAVSLSIAFLFLLITFWIFYEYSGSKISANDALSTTGSYFGAVATLGAAIIAAYLFNDWGIQHNKEMSNKFVFHVYDQFIIVEKLILDLGLFVDNINTDSPTNKIPFIGNDNKYFKVVLDGVFDKQEKIDLEISYLIDRFREYGVVTGRLLEFESFITQFIKEFSAIHTVNVDEISDLNDYKKREQMKYQKYNHLREKVNSQIIFNLLTGLQVK